MERERYQRLITRDHMTSELMPLLGNSFRPEILTAPRPRFSGMVYEGALTDDTIIEERRYRFKRVITAEIYEYEEY